MNFDLRQDQGGKAIAQGAVALTETYVKEAELEKYTTKFLLDNYAKAARDIPQQDVDFKQKAKAPT